MLIGQPVFAVRTGIQAVVRHDIIPYPLESFSDKLVVGVTLRVRKTALINVIIILCLHNIELDTRKSTCNRSC